MRKSTMGVGGAVLAVALGGAAAFTLPSASADHGVPHPAQTASSCGYPTAKATNVINRLSYQSGPKNFKAEGTFLKTGTCTSPATVAYLYGNAPGTPVRYSLMGQAQVKTNGTYDITSNNTAVPTSGTWGFVTLVAEVESARATASVP